MFQEMASLCTDGGGGDASRVQFHDLLQGADVEIRFWEKHLQYTAKRPRDDVRGVICTI